MARVEGPRRQCAEMGYGEHIYAQSKGWETHPHYDARGWPKGFRAPAYGPAAACKHASRAVV